MDGAATSRAARSDQAAGGAPVPPPGRRFCRDCSYYRPPAQVVLYEPQDLLSGKVIEVLNRLAAEDRTDMETERQLVDSGAEFDWIPRFYPWCQKYTDERRDDPARSYYVVNPVTGAESPTYALCKRMNSIAACPGFEWGDSHAPAQ